MSDPRGAPDPSRASRIYRALLRLYPREFRDAHEQDAVDLFCDRYADEREKGGRFWVATFWFRTLLNVAWHGSAERLARPDGHRRDAAPPSWSLGFLGDVRSVARAFRGSPGFTVGVSGILALGLGATIFVFTLVRGVLLRPLPYPDDHQIVQLWERNQEIGLEKEGPSPWNFADWQRLSTSFHALAAWYLTSATYRDERTVEELRVARVTTRFFDVLGVEPALGRDFLDVEGPTLGPVILSDRFWRRTFGGDPGVVGQSIELGGLRHEVVGVMPPGFAFPDRSIEYWIAWDLPSAYVGNPESRTWRFLAAAARLSPGVSIEDAEAELAAVHAGLADAYPDANRGWSVRVTSLRAEILGNVGGTLAVALGCVGFVLLLTCANVANLLLARAPLRATEFAIRSAVGAGRARLARQLVVENVGLAALGGLVGIPLVVGLLSLVRRYGGGRIPRIEEVSIDPTVVGFSVLVISVTSLAFGLAPLLHLVRNPVASLIRRAGGGSSGGALGSVRSGFVAAQIALALVLLVGAGLFWSSLDRLRSVDLGFEPAETLTFRVSLDARRTAENNPTTISDYYKTLLSRLSELPNVVAVGAAQTLPMNPVGNDFTRPFRPVGTALASAEAPKASMRMVTPGYFRAAGLRLLSGDTFTGTEEAEGPWLALVNQTMADRLWPGQSPIGEAVELDFRDGWQPYRVIGVVADVRHSGPKGAPTNEIYLSHRQVPYLAMSVVIRTAGEPESMIPAVRDAVRAVPPGQPAHSFVGFEELLASNTAADRLLALLLLAFAAVSLGLATGGVYSVVAYSVSSRSRELGVRMALGAESRDLVRQVTSGTAKTALLGLAVGVAVSLVVGPGLDSLLFEVSAAEPAVFLVSASGLFGVAVLAGFLSARKITRLDPSAPLRG